MTIGILKTDDVHPQLVARFGEYPEMFAQFLKEVDSSLEFVTYEVKQMEYPQDLDEVDAYLITGSSYSVYQEIDWIRRLGAFVQQLHQAKKKVIGICFGHQLIAHFLGGQTAASPKGWAIGIQNIALTELGKTLLPNQDNYRLIASHKDQVLIPATGSEILAGSDFCPISMCKIENHILSIQNHPEFTPSYFRGLMSLRTPLFEKNHYTMALESLDSQTTNRLLVARWIIDFLKLETSKSE